MRNEETVFHVVCQVARLAAASPAASGVDSQQTEVTSPPTPQRGHASSFATEAIRQVARDLHLPLSQVVQRLTEAAVDMYTRPGYITTRQLILQSCRQHCPEYVSELSVKLEAASQATLLDVLGVLESTFGATPPTLVNVVDVAGTAAASNNPPARAANSPQVVSLEQHPWLFLLRQNAALQEANEELMIQLGESTGSSGSGGEADSAAPMSVVQKSSWEALRDVVVELRERLSVATVALDAAKDEIMRLRATGTAVATTSHRPRTFSTADHSSQGRNPPPPPAGRDEAHLTPSETSSTSTATSGGASHGDGMPASLSRKLSALQAAHQEELTAASQRARRAEDACVAMQTQISEQAEHHRRLVAEWQDTLAKSTDQVRSFLQRPFVDTGIQCTHRNHHAIASGDADDDEHGGCPDRGGATASRFDAVKAENDKLRGDVSTLREKLSQATTLLLRHARSLPAAIEPNGRPFRPATQHAETAQIRPGYGTIVVAPPRTSEAEGAGSRRRVVG